MKFLTIGLFLFQVFSLQAQPYGVLIKKEYKIIDEFITNLTTPPQVIDIISLKSIELPINKVSYFIILSYSKENESKTTCTLNLSEATKLASAMKLFLLESNKTPTEFISTTYELLTPCLTFASTYKIDYNKWLSSIKLDNVGVLTKSVEILLSTDEIKTLQEMISRAINQSK